MKTHSRDIPPFRRLLRRIAIAFVGGTVLIIGIIMIVLPGPAILVIPLGIGILATEFFFAKRWLVRFRKWTRKVGIKLRSRKRKKPGA